MERWLYLLFVGVLLLAGFGPTRSIAQGGPGLDRSGYITFGGTVLRPIRNQFDYLADTGIGFFAGGGLYLSDAFVAQITFDYDFYISGTLQLRYDFHFKRPFFMIGPTLGYKRMITRATPLDNFVNAQEDLPLGMFIYGITAQIPLYTNSLFFEINYWDSNKDSLAIKFGLMLNF